VGVLPPVEIWPCNQTALAVFQSMESQWRVGFNGKTGLDYNVLPVIFDLLKVKKGDRTEVFHKLQLMEGEALRIFYSDK
jgi:hypothetical protein